MQNRPQLINSKESNMKKIFITLLIALAAVCADALEIIKDGKAQAEIVISPDACNSEKTAASQLQKYLKKISSAELKIVTSPTGEIPFYVGPSKYTKKLGLTIKDIKNDGFKIIVTDKYAAILGFDDNRRPIPDGNTRFGVYYKVLKEWQEYTGHKWDFRPALNRDGRNYRFGNGKKPLSFHDRDATGTLYGVYDFLESLGCRFFMPIEDLGEVVPKMKTVNLANRNIKSDPVIEFRDFFMCGFRTDYEFLWFKGAMRNGGTFEYDPNHSCCNITAYQKNRPELFAYSKGKPYKRGPKLLLPRLSSPELRSELAEFVLKYHEKYPEIKYYPIAQPDGWNVLDERDVKAGWDKVEEGNWGRFSDYMWDFALDVAKKIRAKNPNIKFSTLSYGYAKKPPKIVDKIPEYFSITFSQNSTMWHLPLFKGELELREEWEKKAPNSNFFIYDYYLQYRNSRNFPPIPVQHIKMTEENFKNLPKRTKAYFTEVPVSSDKKSASRLKWPGLSHLRIYLHSKLVWNRNVDLNALLEDYYKKFFGPAAKEMKEFYEFTEKVWMRPGDRQITAYSGFVRPKDIDKFFEILKRAKLKAGDTIYGKRVDLISSEMAPLKNLFDSMKRTGPYVRMRTVRDRSKVNIDGNPNKDFWTKQLAGEKLYLRDNLTGEYPHINRTVVKARWHNNALVLGITCYERRMNEIRATVPKGRINDSGIWNDDTLEVRLETPKGYRIFLAVNPNGALFSKVVTPDVTEVASAWRPDDICVKKFPDRWYVEMRISNIGKMPTKAIPWGFNVCRDRRAGPVEEAYALSPTGGRFNQPSKYANLWNRGKH